MAAITEDRIRNVLATIPIRKGDGRTLQGEIINTIRIDGEGVKVSLYLELNPQERMALEAIVAWELEKLEGVGDAQIYMMSPPQPEKPIGQKPIPEGPAAQANPAGQRRPAPPPKTPVAGVKHILAVASGKGGVGKSTVSANVALALADQGQKVGLLDADLYGPSIPMMFGVSGQLMRTPHGKIRPLEKHGIKLMSIGLAVEDDTPVIWRGLMVMKMIRQFLLTVEWGELDFLVIDLPPGTGDTQLTIVQTVDVAGAIVVTTPQDVALADARKGFEMFRTVKVPVVGIVENMSSFVCPSCGHEEHIFAQGGGKREADRLNVPFLGEVPLNPEICKSGDGGTPIYASQPESREGVAFKTIARTVLKTINERKEQGQPG